MSFIIKKGFLSVFGKYFGTKHVKNFVRFTSGMKNDFNNHHGPLSGFRVLDLTRILAGPFCTMILGDLGAEILKIENPEGGDASRNWGPPFVNGESAYFLSINRNKKSITIDFKKPEGKNLIQQLTKKCDILVENFVPGKLSSIGLGYENLREVSPHLIYCSITGYGSTGPYSRRAGYDVIAASIGGFLGITGPENGDPCKAGVATTDLATGLYAHGAIMAALIQRSKTGIGQKISCDLLSTQVSLLTNIASNYLNSGNDAKRWGTAHESIVPYETFRTKDGFLTIGAGSNKQFKVLCKLLHVEYIWESPLYSTNENRVKNRKSLTSCLSKIFSEFPNEHWLKVFEGSGIPYGPVNKISEVFQDLQVVHNKMVLDIEHPTAGDIKILGPAVSFSNSINKPRSSPPTLGQHTNIVLSDLLNLSEDDLLILKNNQII